jgi:sulfite reductase beta subunit-like hemoprotein
LFLGGLLDVGPVTAAELKEIAKSVGDSDTDTVDMPSRAADQAAAEEGHTGIRELEKPETFSVGVPVLLGRLTGEQLRKAADVAERHGNATLRMTTNRVLLFPEVQKEKVATLLESLQTVGLNVNMPPLLRGASACLDQKPLAKEILEHLQAGVPLLDPVRFHMCGCEPACANLPETDFSLKRSAQGFDLCIGDKPAASDLPQAELKIRLEQLIAGYKKRRKKGESLKDFCARIGDAELALLLSPKTSEADETD